MICEQCGEVSYVSDTRDSKLFRGAIRRRRFCKTCNYRWTTIELNEDAARYLYAKKDPGANETIERMDAGGQRDLLRPR